MFNKESRKLTSGYLAQVGKTQKAAPSRERPFAFYLNARLNEPRRLT